MNVILRGCRMHLRETVPAAEGRRSTWTIASWDAQGIAIPDRVLALVPVERHAEIHAAVGRAVLGGQIPVRPRHAWSAAIWDGHLEHLDRSIRSSVFTPVELQMIAKRLCGLRRALHTHGVALPIHEARSDMLPVVILDDASPEIPDAAGQAAGADGGIS